MLMNTFQEHDWRTRELPCPPGMASLVLADPPYNFGVEYADDETNDSLPFQEYVDGLLAPAIGAAMQLTAPGGTIAWICPAAHGGVVWAMFAQGFPQRYEALYGAPVIWYETFSQYQQKRLTEDYRFIFLIKKPGGTRTFNPDDIRIPSRRQEMGDKRADPRGRVPGMVWQIRRLQGTSKDRVDWHSAQLPPELIERLVLGWTNPNDLVLDMFSGSGNAGVASSKLGRRFLGFDKSPSYVEKANERLGS